MRVIFFNGMSVRIYPCVDVRNKCKRELEGQTIEEFYGTLLSMPLKHLELAWYDVDVSRCRHRPYRCVLEQLLLRILTRSMKLESLKVTELPLDVKLGTPSGQSEKYGLPKLKILEIEDDNVRSLLSSNLLAQIIALAPNLQQLKFTLRPDLVPLMPPGSVQLVKHMKVDYFMVGPDFVGQTEELSRRQPKLRSVFIEKPKFELAEAERRKFYGSLGLILFHSSSTLEYVTMDLLAFGPIGRQHILLLHLKK